MAVYGYSRVSTDKQASEGDSLEVQARQLAGWAMMQGSTIDAVYVEEGISGSMPLADRPQGRLLLECLAKGDTVVAVKLDRMFRSALDALQVVDALEKRGVRLVLLDLGEVTDGLSKLFLTIAAAFAEAERDRIRDRIRTAKADGKARGRYLGGKQPYGYAVQDGQLVEVPAEQAVIASIRSRVGSMSVRAIRLEVMALHGLDVLSLATVAKAAAQ